MEYVGVVNRPFFGTTLAHCFLRRFACVGRPLRRAQGASAKMRRSHRPTRGNGRNLARPNGEGD